MKQNSELIRKTRAMQKVVFSIFNNISVTRTNAINNIQKTVSKFVFT